MKRRTVFGAALLATPIAWGAAPPRREPRSALGRIRQRGVLKVAVIPQQPWYFQDDAQKWIGLDVDVCTKLAADLGVTVGFLTSTWSGIADDVALGDADIAASLWPTPRRALSIAFSDAYAQTQVTLIAHRERAAGLTRAADFNQPTVRIGTRSGGLAEWIAGQKFPTAQLRDFPSEAEQWQALLAGDLHAVVAQTPLPEAFAAEGHPQLTLPLAEPLSWRRESFAVPPRDNDLLLYLNAWLRHHEDSGWLPARRMAWFGNQPARTP